MANVRSGRSVDTAIGGLSFCWLLWALAPIAACAIAPGPDAARAQASAQRDRERTPQPPKPAEVGPTPDLALVNAKIFTADPAQPWAQALTIRGDRLETVGSNAEVSGTLSPKTRVIDLAGKVVIPGINDAHLHEPLVWRRVDVDTRGLTSVAAVIDRVADEAARHPEGTWLRTGDLSPAFADDPALVRAELDRKLPRHPALFVLLGDHAACLNSAALSAWHISEGSKPEQGRHGRGPDGKLDGWLYEYALWSHYSAMTETESDDSVSAAAERFAQQAIRFGITSVQTMPLQIPSERLARVLSERATPLRWRVIRFPKLGIDPLEGPVPAPPVTDRVRLDGIKYILDGTPIERGAAKIAGYHDRPREKGHLDFSDAELSTIFERCQQSGVPLLLHVAGDAAAQQALRIMQQQRGLEAWSGRRVRFEHGDGVLAFLDQLRRAEVVVVQNPAHFALLPGLEQRDGNEQRTALYPLKSLLAGGISIALGSDGPLNPFLGILLASLHPANPREALTREQAVVAYTRGSAYAEFAETVKGTLAAGMLADIAVLSQDIFAVSNDRLPATTSVLTLVGGQIVYAVPDVGSPKGRLSSPN